MNDISRLGSLNLYYFAFLYSINITTINSVLVYRISNHFFILLLLRKLFGEKYPAARMGQEEEGKITKKHQEFKFVSRECTDSWFSPINSR
jgi:hypothetical protein